MLFSPFSYEMPTRVEFGRGAAKKAGEEVKRAGGARALVISDGGVAGAGLLDKAWALWGAELDMVTPEGAF